VSSLEYDRKNDDEETNVFWLAIVTANELGLAFPPIEPSQKISARSVHVLFSYRGNEQTDKRTPVIT